MRCSSRSLWYTDGATGAAGTVTGTSVLADFMDGPAEDANANLGLFGLTTGRFARPPAPALGTAWDELAPARPRDMPGELPVPWLRWGDDGAASSDGGTTRCPSSCSVTHDDLDGPPDSVLLPDGRVFIASELVN